MTRHALIIGLATGALAASAATSAGFESASASPAIQGRPAVRPCASTEVRTLVTRFVRSFNAGDFRTLNGLFAREPDFEWYSTDGPGQRLRAAAFRRWTLIEYFRSRHAKRELLQLRSFRFNGNGGVAKPHGNFEFVLVRRARDLAPSRYHGKGAAYCDRTRDDVIFVWSMGRQ